MFHGGVPLQMDSQITFRFALTRYFWRSGIAYSKKSAYPSSKEKITAGRSFGTRWRFRRVVTCARLEKNFRSPSKTSGCIGDQKGFGWGETRCKFTTDTNLRTRMPRKST